MSTRRRPFEETSAETPAAIHSLAPSQNVFLGSVAQRTRRMRFGPCVYVPPLHHPLRLIEEISMLDNLSDGRLEIGVGRGGVMEAFFWGQEADPETNYARYCSPPKLCHTTFPERAQRALRALRTGASAS